MTRDELLERGDETVTLRQLVERFESVEKEYSGMPWTLKQIYQQIDMLISEKPCEDCISREATVERLCKVAEFMNEKRAGLGSPYVMAALFIQDNKEEFPSVTPQPKMGRWIEHFDESGKWYECDQCHTDWGGTVNYCPNCGADMGGDANVNDK